MNINWIVISFFIIILLPVIIFLRNDGKDRWE